MLEDPPLTQAEARIFNIEQAAILLADEGKARGRTGEAALINACYERELNPAKSLTPGLEACLAQDIISSKIAAQVFGGVSEEARRLANVPAPQLVLEAMAKRVYGVLGKFKVPPSDAREINVIIQKNGMEAYGRQRFPEQFEPKAKMQ